MSVNIDDCDGRKMALVVTECLDDGEGDSVCWIGVGRVVDDTLFFDCEDATKPVEIQEAWVDRLVQLPDDAPAEVKEEFEGADYILWLSSGRFPDGGSEAEVEGMASLGLVWPGPEEEE